MYMRPLRLFYLFLFMSIFAYSADIAKLGAAGQKSVSFKCNRIFELRKQELLDISRNITDQQQELDAEKLASENIIEIKDKKLRQKEKDLDTIKAVLEKKERTIRKLLAENKRILRNIEKRLADRVREAYESMPPGKAALSLEAMSNERSAGIMYGMKSAKIGEIFAKMTPQKSSEIALVIKRGPPFKTNKKHFILKKPENFLDNIIKDFGEK